MSALKPCPWCGDSVLEVRESVVTGAQWVACTGCGVSSQEAPDEPAAIAAWNRRAGDAEVEKLRAELSAARDALQNMLGAFNTPLRRRRMPGDFYDAAIDSARTALGDTP